MPEPESVGLLSKSESTRTLTFLAIQVGFLAVSPFAGGFQKAVWSMLDSAILVLSIGITGLVFTLEAPTHRKLAFRAAVVLYLLAVLDMSVNILVSGVVGWKDAL